MTSDLPALGRDEYRAVAAELRLKARLEEDRKLAAEWMRLAVQYARLADEAVTQPA